MLIGLVEVGGPILKVVSTILWCPRLHDGRVGRNVNQASTFVSVCFFIVNAQGTNCFRSPAPWLSSMMAYSLKLCAKINTVTKKLFLSGCFITKPETKTACLLGLGQHAVPSRKPSESPQTRSGPVVHWAHDLAHLLHCI